MDRTPFQFLNLVKDAQRGNQEAQAALIDQTQNQLFKFCILLGHNRELAEDLCQETYIKAFASLGKIQKPEAFVGWLLQIAKNLFLDYMRSTSRKETDLDQLENKGADPEYEMILNVQKVLSQFEPEERILLLLVELEGYSYKEAGEIIGKSEDAVRSKLHRLREQFIKKFKTGETNGGSDPSTV